MGLLFMCLGNTCQAPPVRHALCWDWNSEPNSSLGELMACGPAYCLEPDMERWRGH